MPFVICLSIVNRVMVTTFTTPCQASPNIWRNPSGELFATQVVIQIFENILDRSKLVIHEADEPPLGVPGELHFDDEEEEVERGGLGFELQNIILILKY